MDQWLCRPCRQTIYPISAAKGYKVRPASLDDLIASIRSDLEARMIPHSKPAHKKKARKIIIITKPSKRTKSKSHHRREHHDGHRHKRRKDEAHHDALLNALEKAAGEIREVYHRHTSKSSSRGKHSKERGPIHDCCLNHILLVFNTEIMKALSPYLINSSGILPASYGQPYIPVPGVMLNQFGQTMMPPNANALDQLHQHLASSPPEEPQLLSPISQPTSKSKIKAPTPTGGVKTKSNPTSKTDDKKKTPVSSSKKAGTGKTSNKPARLSQASTLVGGSTPTLFSSPPSPLLPPQKPASLWSSGLGHMRGVAESVNSTSSGGTKLGIIPEQKLGGGLRRPPCDREEYEGPIMVLGHDSQPKKKFSLKFWK
ncbi:hypothetical protein FQN57_006108 [Myotisia sp. PD_48]|nr:hypothetical protein FQN57_006108 [Myotisia sp. PD_48]